MGKRYYCDYCDRSFIDDVDSRKKHIQGTNHERNRKLHYKYCRDLKTLVEEEQRKEECRRFRSTGECPFGELCHYTHYTHQELRTLQAQAEENERRSLTKVVDTASVDDWLQKTRAKKKGSSNKKQTVRALDSLDLPPSLQPVDLRTNYQLTLEWG